MAFHPELRITIGSRYEELELLEQVADGFLRYLEWDEDDRPNILLAIREAAANSVQHGNHLDDQAPVELFCTVNQHNLLVRVTDQGPGFDPDVLPDPLAPENLLKPNGRGILLIRNFMDGVTFHFPGGGGTRVTMHKRLKGSLAPGTQHSKEDG